MKIFKNSIDQSTVNWTQETVKRLVKQIQSDFSKLDDDSELPAQLPNIIIDKQELTNELNKITREASYLKSFSDAVGFINSQKINITDKDGQISLVDLQNLVQFNPTTGIAPPMAKLMIKIQFGRTFNQASKVLDFIRDLQNKIGKEELVKEIDAVDVEYLLNKGIKEIGVDIENYIERNKNNKNKDISKDISEEVAVINSPTVTWAEKTQAKDVIVMFADRSYQSYVNNNLSIDTLLNVETKQKEWKEFIAISALINQLTLKIDFGDCLLKQIQIDAKVE
ncbi:hypothetical protein LD125_00301 [Mesoplasma sp. JKS002658]|uniref:hypothetical protein n=1 Tax=Mesoplasma whartonense TaxID=2878854 RepID=UPI0020229CED|nr:MULTISPECIES: hypothetical protein [unclassified Mesoplasma]MCL8211194.1 hypothetical protein [Mesoplasma sp. JKS002664]MCL8211855.1 hypothetical protein [Mesoplasma sp. JKS002662]MCL8212913.1 hypothetical protein [Mesoplasma sp. JKS002661]MCL8213163.1 hypothetical protein [Mesoplasma sp. JKS002660]MCL8214040.1 hypothetical protein [Mesoplasma sp. JKS002658]